LEAWSQLAELYSREYQFGPAAFCVEELVLAEPFNYLHHLRLAEITFTMHKLRLAVKHYCRVLELNAGCLRALFGLKLCLNQLLGEEGGGEASRDTWKALDLKITEKLLSKYSGDKSTSRVGEVVKRWLAPS